MLPIDSKYNTHHKLCFIFDTKFYKKQGVWTMGSTPLIEDDWDVDAEGNAAWELWEWK